MENLLSDIELDIQELKCLMQAISTDANPALRIVAKRNIRQMKARLDALQELLEEVPTTATPPAPVAPEPPEMPSEEPEAAHSAETAAPVETVQAVAVQPSPILAERIKPSANLRQSISLNDSFRFTRELFAGNASRMNEVVRRLGEAPSLEKAMEIFTAEVRPDEENEAAADFVELLKKHFS